MICLVAVVGVMGLALVILREMRVISSERVQLQSGSPLSARSSLITAVTEVTKAPPAVSKGNDSSISPRRLELLLIRTQPGRIASEGFAQIGVFRESPQTYVVGAMLENGARLIEIHSDHVVLQKGMQTTRLYLADRRASGRNGDTGMLTVGGENRNLPPARITSREALTDYMRPSPVYEGDRLLGYQVYSGAHTGPFTQLGLQAGDLITAVGGTPLNDSGTAWEILRELMDGAVLPAVVLRHGETETLTLDGSILTRAEEARALRTDMAMMTPTVPGTGGP
jgi:general secretion pathway protein C